MLNSLRTRCEKKGLKEDELQNNLHISLQNKWIYVQNAKVACSTIKYNLIQLELEQSGLINAKYKDIIPKLLHEPMYGPMLHPFQIPMKSFNNIFKDDNFFKFTFVRNPFSRILSTYLDKIVRNGTPKIHIVRSLNNSNNVDTQSYVSFKEFIELLHKDKAILYRDRHWRPQSNNLMFPIMKYDFIGRFEDFDSDFQKVKKNIQQGDFVEKSIYNYSPHKTSATDKIKDYYCNDCIKLVLEIYKDDFDLFNYSKEP